MKTNKSGNWEERFDKLGDIFKYLEKDGSNSIIVYRCSDDVKDFIRKVQADTRQQTACEMAEYLREFLAEKPMYGGVYRAIDNYIANL